MTTSAANTGAAIFDENVAEQTTITEQTQSELAQICFSHAQVLIAVGLFQFTSILLRVASSADHFLDYDNSDATFLQVEIVEGIGFTFAIAILILASWLLFRSGIYQNQTLWKKHRTTLWPRGKSGFLANVAVAILVLSVLSTHSVLFGLRKTNQMPGGLIDKLFIIQWLVFSVLFLVGAVFRVRQGMKFLTLGTG